MKFIYYFLTFTALTICTSLNGQNHYKIRLQTFQDNPPNKSCYYIQLAAADGVPLSMAGQNYRLYYNSRLLSLNQEQAKYLLPEEKYINFTVKNIVSKEGTEGIGLLPFSQIGFANLSVDLKNTEEGGINLPSTGDWITTCQLCFDIQAMEEEEEEAINIVWARPTLTQNYATAYVEVAEWVEKNHTRPTEAVSYGDLSLSTSTIHTQWEDLPNIYPNPTRSELWIEQENATTPVMVQLQTIEGKEVLSNQIPVGQHQFQLDVSNLMNGLYQLVLRKDNRIYSQLIEKL